MQPALGAFRFKAEAGCWTRPSLGREGIFHIHTERNILDTTDICLDRVILEEAAVNLSFRRGFSRIRRFELKHSGTGCTIVQTSLWSHILRVKTIKTTRVNNDKHTRQ